MSAGRLGMFPSQPTKDHLRQSPSPSVFVNEEAAQMHHNLIKPGSRDPTTGANDLFSLHDCPGAVENLDQLLRKSNMEDLQLFKDSPTELCDAIVNKINEGRRPHARRPSTCSGCFGTFGRMVPDGHIQFIEHRGRTEAVSAGLWSIRGWNSASWAKVVQMSVLSEARIS